MISNGEKHHQKLQNTMDVYKEKNATPRVGCVLVMDQKNAPL